MIFEILYKPRSASALLSLTCIALLAFGIYLQEIVGLEPCPMCIVQRYSFILIAVCSGMSYFINRPRSYLSLSIVTQIVAVFGAFVAARQSWLQWFPPETMSCGRDLYGMIENFPLKRAIPMIFKGSGDCTVVDWTFLGGSIANWSYLCFLGIITYIALIQVKSFKRHKQLKSNQSNQAN